MTEPPNYRNRDDRTCKTCCNFDGCNCEKFEWKTSSIDTCDEWSERVTFNHVSANCTRCHYFYWAPPSCANFKFKFIDLEIDPRDVNCDSIKVMGKDNFLARERKTK